MKKLDFCKECKVGLKNEEATAVCCLLGYDASSMPRTYQTTANFMANNGKVCFRNNWRKAIVKVDKTDFKVQLQQIRHLVPVARA